MPQAAGRRPRPVQRPVLQNCMHCSSQAAWFFVCVCAIAFMFINLSTQVKLLGNSIALLVEIQRNLKYDQLGAACGSRPGSMYEPAFRVNNKHNVESVCRVALYYICIYFTLDYYLYYIILYELWLVLISIIYFSE